MNLEKIDVIKKKGSEPFHIDGKSLDHDLLSFWQWSSSDVIGNALRGVLAEYIVSMDIKCPYQVREEWDAYDLITPEHVKVEVKSASYLQSWEQKKYSAISFGIQPTIMWEDGNIRSSEAKRQTDVYVFCVFAHKRQESVDPLNLAQWEFYILPTSTLNEKVNNQKTITLTSLLTLHPAKCKYGEIHEKIQEISG
ncbi:MAG: hypothetical protein HOD92_26510 [Deltaproteobacteria bacterium]|jgi:hypothetical protein|nr:hypothetical protein [Deltaproteobacteria bacterium]